MVIQSGYGSDQSNGHMAKLWFLKTNISDEVRNMWDLDCIGISGKFVSTTEVPLDMQQLGLHLQNS